MNNAKGPTKAERREAARAQAAALKAKQEAAEKRSKRIMWGALGGILAVLAAIIIAILVNNARQNADNFGAPNLDESISLADVANVPSVARTDGGIVVGAGGVAGAPENPDVPELGIFLDYRCSACYQLENAQMTNLQAMMDTGTANVILYPVSVLGEDSVRIGAAAAWVADRAPEQFFAYHVALFEDVFSTGASNANANLADVARGVGVPGAVAEGIRTGEAFYTYGQWVTSSSQNFLTWDGLEHPSDGRRGTPTVMINGVRWFGDWMNDPASLVTAVAEATN